MDGNTVTGLVTITLTVVIQVIAMQIFIAFLGRPGIRSDQQNSGSASYGLKTEGTDPVLFDSTKGSVALAVQMPNVL